MKQTLKQLADFFATIFDTPKSTRLEDYITWKRPQNHADLDRIVREYNEMRMW
jgi:hypothetical protein